METKRKRRGWLVVVEHRHGSHEDDSPTEWNQKHILKAKRKAEAQEKAYGAVTTEKFLSNARIDGIKGSVYNTGSVVIHSSDDTHWHETQIRVIEG